MNRNCYNCVKDWDPCKQMKREACPDWGGGDGRGMSVSVCLCVGRVVRAGFSEEINMS